MKKHNQFDYRDLELFLTIVKETNSKYSLFLTTKVFENLLVYFSDSMKTARSFKQISTYHRDLIMELKRYSTPVEGRANSKENLTQDEKARKVNLLTKKIKETNKKIAELENAEISLDEMDDATIFTKLSKLKNFVVKLWRKRELLNNHSIKITGQSAFKKFTYSRSKNNDVNKLVEKYFSLCTQKLRERENSVINGRKNKKSSTSSEKFDGLNVIGLRNFLNKEIEMSKISYSVSEAELTQIFEDITKEQNKRRWSDFNDTLFTLSEEYDCKQETPLPNDVDKELKERTEQNDKQAALSMESIVAKFGQLDKEQNKILDPEFLGQDDVGENEMDLDDEEEEEKKDDDESSEHDEEAEDLNDNVDNESSALDAEESIENGLSSTSLDQVENGNKSPDHIN